ncbi:MAG: DUF3467 domain-containing protein [Phycisphaerae bacterium]
MTENNDPSAQPQGSEIPQDAQRQTRVRLDEREMQTSYANAFRANGTAEEIMLDFGLNIVSPGGQQGGQTPEILFKIDQRVILNYYSAKRLAMTLTQMVRRHEQNFGELELDVNKRRQDAD